ncbi:MAG TPA: hypothetical protein VK020_02335 [Microlunatus sp.]|nr:hypothetical protein [Microlunatus sp.]
MYEMYPDDWSATVRAGRSVPGDADAPPRRRPRKAHSVAPPVIERQRRQDRPADPVG